MGGKRTRASGMHQSGHEEALVEFRNGDFVQLVKRTREKFGVSIQEAHDMIFADKEARRLVAWRINNDQQCRKEVPSLNNALRGGNATSDKLRALQ